MESQFPPLKWTQIEGATFLRRRILLSDVWTLAAAKSRGSRFHFYTWIFFFRLLVVFFFSPHSGHFLLADRCSLLDCASVFTFLNERMCLLWKSVCVRVVLCLGWYMNPLRSEPILILPWVVKNIEYLLNLWLLLERLSCYCYNALPAISVYICYYNRKKKPQGAPRILRTESFMSSPVSSCDTFGGPWGHIVKCDEWQTNKTAKDFRVILFCHKDKQRLITYCIKTRQTFFALNWCWTF